MTKGDESKLFGQRLAAQGLIEREGCGFNAPCRRRHASAGQRRQLSSLDRSGDDPLRTLDASCGQAHSGRSARRPLVRLGVRHVWPTQTPWTDPIILGNRGGQTIADRDGFGKHL